MLPLMWSAFVPFNLVTSVINGALTVWMVAMLRDRIPALRGADAR
jgi:Flp pilus assembly protein protease CpaA